LGGRSCKGKKDYSREKSGKVVTPPSSREYAFKELYFSAYWGIQGTGGKNRKTGTNKTSSVDHEESNGEG